MKTRIILNKCFFIALSSAIMFFTACSDGGDEPPGPGPGGEEEYKLAVDNKLLEFEAYATMPISLDVKTDAPSWKPACEDEWVKVIKSDGTLTILPEYYYEEQERRSVVRVEAEGAKPVSIPVLQKGRVYDIEASVEQVLFVSRDANPTDFTVTSNVDDWVAVLESKEFFTLRRNGDKLTVTPVSVNTADDPRRTDIVISVGPHEKLRIPVMQRGHVEYSTYLGKYRVQGTPCIWVKEPFGKSEWECEIKVKEEGISYTMTNFPGEGFEVELLMDNQNLTMEPLQILHMDDVNMTVFRLYYDDLETGLLNTYYGTYLSEWDSLGKVIKFENTYGSYPIIMQVLGYSAETGLVVGAYTDGYSEIRLTRLSQ